MASISQAVVEQEQQPQPQPQHVEQEPNSELRPFAHMFLSPPPPPPPLLPPLLQEDRIATLRATEEAKQAVAVARANAKAAAAARLRETPVGRSSVVFCTSFLARSYARAHSGCLCSALPPFVLLLCYSRNFRRAW